MSTDRVTAAATHGRPVGLREQSRRETMERIRAAAVKLLADKGYDQITTREVAREANVGEATLFRYVSSKEELLLLAIGDQMDRHIDELFESDAALATTTKSESGSDFLTRVMAIYKGRADFYLTAPETVTRYLQYAFNPGSALGAQNVAQGDRVVQLVDAILKEGQAVGVLLPNVSSSAVARNCQGIYVHEVLRREVRGYEVDSIWQRMKERLDAQLIPLAMPNL